MDSIAPQVPHEAHVEFLCNLNCLIVYTRISITIAHLTPMINSRAYFSLVGHPYTVRLNARRLKVNGKDETQLEKP